MRLTALGSTPTSINACILLLSKANFSMGYANSLELVEWLLKTVFIEHNYNQITAF